MTPLTHILDELDRDIRKLLDATRALLDQHTPDSVGCCSACPPTGQGWRYAGVIWPCPVIDTISHFLHTEDQTQVADTSA